MTIVYEIPTLRVWGTNVQFEVTLDMYGSMPEEVSYMECPDPDCGDAGNWILHPHHQGGEFECQSCGQLVECTFMGSRWSDEPKGN